MYVVVVVVVLLLFMFCFALLCFVSPMMMIINGPACLPVLPVYLPKFS
jgi:hypothetical protein